MCPPSLFVEVPLRFVFGAYIFYAHGQPHPSTLNLNLGNLRKMVDTFGGLDLSMNFLSSLPTQLSELQNEFKFDLSHNMLKSNIPTQLGKLKKIHHTILLNENSLTSTIPTELGNAVNLQNILDLARNSITSTIPTELGKLVNLELSFSLGDPVLDLEGNSLSSTIPTELGELKRLTGEFELNSLALTAALPTEIGELVVMSLNIVGNLLSSSMPTELGRLVEMDGNFLLSSNRLGSTIPTELGNIFYRCMLNTGRICSHFEFEANRLCPILPTELGAIAGSIDTTGFVGIQRPVGLHWQTKPNPLDACSRSIYTALDSTSIDLDMQQLTGSIPTQVIVAQIIVLLEVLIQE